jgi:uncharacterized membrane protein YkoI
MKKSISSNPKKAIITIACVLTAITFVGAGTVFAVGTVAENTSIGAEKAEMFAFADAGVDPVSAHDVHSEFDFENGMFLYEVDFEAEGTEYDYGIHAFNGTVVKKNARIVNAYKAATNTSASADQTAATDKAAPETTAASEQTTDDAGVTDVTQDSADRATTADQTAATDKAAPETTAVSEQTTDDAGVTDVTQDSADRATTADQTATAAMPQTVEAAEARSQNMETIGLAAAKATALDNAGLSESDVTFTKAELDTDDGMLKYDLEFFTSSNEYDYEVNAQSGAIIEKSVEAIERSVKEQKSYIGVDKAKTVALEHAGISTASASFSKAKLDNDDGKVVYEIEFYVGRTEYDYEIDAYSGTILEYDIDND